MRGKRDEAVNLETCVDIKRFLHRRHRLEGVGKGTADKIKEFLTTGKCQKLEEKRAAAGGG